MNNNLFCSKDNYSSVVTTALKWRKLKMCIANFSFFQGLSHNKPFLLRLRLGFKAVLRFQVRPCFTGILSLLQVQKMCSISLCGIWRLSKGTPLTCRWQPIIAQPCTTNAESDGPATAFPPSQTSTQTLTSKPDVCCYVRDLVEINVHELCCESS